MILVILYIFSLARTPPRAKCNCSALERRGAAKEYERRRDPTLLIYLTTLDGSRPTKKQFRLEQNAVDVERVAALSCRPDCTRVGADSCTAAQDHW